MRGRVAIVLILIIAVIIIAAFIYEATLLKRVESGLPTLVSELLKDKSESIRVSVDCIKNGRITEKCTCDAARPQPPLIRWNSVKGAQAYLVIVLDPDAPAGTFVHLIAYDGVETRWPSPGYKLGVNTAGRLGWFPVCPPPGDRPHRYYFVVVALREPLGLGEGADVYQVLAAARERVVAYGYTMGRYARSARGG